MKAKTLTITLLAVTVLLTLAAASMIIPANENAKENAKAPEKSRVIGDNWELERVEFIHYAKPPNEGKPPKTEDCYKLLRVKWNSLPVSYVINPANNEGLEESFVTYAVSASAETWDGATNSELFNNYTINNSVQYGVLDSKNAVAFGDYPNDNVIAITSIWYNRRTKEIVEFDILFNTRFSWGDATEKPGVMDLQNIATHELGHGVGLNDVYSTMCSAVTMYGYSTEGETSKRTLEPADIAGLQKMYGA